MCGLDNQHVSTFNPVFELLEKNFLGHFGSRRARRSLWARRARRTGWARLVEERCTKRCHASIWSEYHYASLFYLQFTAVHKKIPQSSSSSIKYNCLETKTARHTVYLLGLPGVVCVCDTFQGSCPPVFWQSPSMILVDPLAGCPKSAAETKTQT